MNLRYIDLSSAHSPSQGGGCGDKPRLAALFLKKNTTGILSLTGLQRKRRHFQNWGGGSLQILFTNASCKNHYMQVTSSIYKLKVAFFLSLVRPSVTSTTKPDFRLQTCAMAQNLSLLTTPCHKFEVDQWGGQAGRCVDQERKYNPGKTLSQANWTILALIWTSHPRILGYISIESMRSVALWWTMSQVKPQGGQHAKMSLVGQRWYEITTPSTGNPEAVSKTGNPSRLCL